MGILNLEKLEALKTSLMNKNVAKEYCDPQKPIIGDYQLTNTTTTLTPSVTVAQSTSTITDKAPFYNLLATAMHSSQHADDKSLDLVLEVENTVL